MLIECVAAAAPALWPALWPPLATTAAALIGVGGIVLSLNRNAKLAQTGETRRFNAEQRAITLALARSADSLRRALLAELQVMRDVFNSEVDFVRMHPFTFVPATNVSTIYLSSVKDLGLLSSDEVAALVKAHGSYQERIAYIVRRGDAPLASGAVGIRLDDGDNREVMLIDLDAIVTAATEAVTVLTACTGGRIPLVARHSAVRPAPVAQQPP